MDQDTSARARARYHEHLRRLTPVERFRAALALSAGVRNLALAGIKSRHPHASAEELRCRLTVRLYGRAIALRLHGSVPEDAR